MKKNSLTNEKKLLEFKILNNWFERKLNYFSFGGGAKFIGNNVRIAPDFDLVGVIFYIHTFLNDMNKKLKNSEIRLEEIVLNTKYEEAKNFYLDVIGFDSNSFDNMLNSDFSYTDNMNRIKGDFYKNKSEKYEKTLFKTLLASEVYGKLKNSLSEEMQTKLRKFQDYKRFFKNLGDKDIYDFRDENGVLNIQKMIESVYGKGVKASTADLAFFEVFNVKVKD